MPSLFRRVQFQNTRRGGNHGITSIPCIIISTLYRHRRNPSDETKKKIEELIGALKDCQAESGGWWYSSVHGGTSFMTAPALIALLEAQHVGFKVAEPTLSKATEFLKKLRNDNGSFEYYLKKQQRGATPVESCIRDPACELALYLAGQSDATKLKAALSNMLRHRAELEKARREGIKWWAGEKGPPHGFAVFFGYFYAVQALHYLDPTAKMDAGNNQTLTPPQAIESIRRTLIGAQSEDGSWKSSDSNPGTYDSNTTMALLALVDKKLLQAEIIKRDDLQPK